MLFDERAGRGGIRNHARYRYLVGGKQSLDGGGALRQQAGADDEDAHRVVALAGGLGPER